MSAVARAFVIVVLMSHLSGCYLYQRLKPFDVSECKQKGCFESCEKLAPLLKWDGKANSCVDAMKVDAYTCSPDPLLNPATGKTDIKSEDALILERCDAKREICATCMRRAKKEKVLTWDDE